MTWGVGWGRMRVGGRGRFVGVTMVMVIYICNRDMAMRDCCLQLFVG